MKPVNDIFADIVKKVSKRYGSNVSFLFGDWAYISNQLTLWGKSPKTSKLKFPIICLYSPFAEDRSSAETEVSLEFIIMVNTLKGYSNEDRQKTSFEQVLRPIYNLFLDEIKKDINIVRSYNDVVPHSYIENYRYGRVGVIGEDGKPFSDFIDAIEMKNVNLTIKEVKCYGNRL